MMNDSQRTINGAWRMMMDNSALSVRPQIIVDQRAIIPQDGNARSPHKVWLKDTIALWQPENPPFQVCNDPEQPGALAGIMELAKAFVDEERLADPRPGRDGPRPRARSAGSRC